MRPSLAVRAARIAVPATVITALGVGVAGAVIPGDDPQVAYPAPAASVPVESSSSATTARSQELSRHKARPPVKTALALKPKISVSETMSPKLKVIDKKYATTELNVRTEPSEDSAVVAGVDGGAQT